MIALRVIGVMLGCYALPWLFQFVTVFLTGDRLSWTEAYVRAAFLLIVLIHINTRPWKE